MRALLLLLLLASLSYGQDFSLADWMGSLEPVLGNQTILDLSLPGTHDSMTWDLSTTVADNANDIDPILAWVLHEFREFTPGNFIRKQAKTQGLNMTEQLESGVRFVDFRIVRSAPPDQGVGQHDWYCLHFVESNRKAMQYLESARKFLDDHPKEIVIFWMSRHGNECETVYPNTTVEEKQDFFKQVIQLFDGLLMDNSVSQLNVTTVSELISRNHRAVFMFSDYGNFTSGHSDFALDGCNIDNQLAGRVAEEATSLPDLIQTFAHAKERREQDKKNGKFYLLSMSAGAPDDQVKWAAYATFDPIYREKHRKDCASTLHIPGTTDWCPFTLQDISQLTNYYSQIAFEKVITDGLDLPNAIYLDAMDKDGAIRTGTELFGREPSLLFVDKSLNKTERQRVPEIIDFTAKVGDNPTTGYAYADTLLLYNLNSACKAMPHPVPECASLRKVLEARRAKNPLKLWSDPYHGRLTDWPPL